MAENNSPGTSFGFAVEAGMFAVAARMASTPRDVLPAPARAMPVLADPLTLRQAAAELHLAPLTLRDAVRRGDLPGVKLGERTVRIRRVDLDAWMRSRRVTPLVRRKK